MTPAAQTMVPSIIPTFRYTDAAAAIDWLCDAFGFERNAVYPDADGSIAHAQLGRAEAAGATIVRAPADQDYGGREYAARDPEGNLWSFGTYAPPLDPNSDGG